MTSRGAIALGFAGFVALDAFERSVSRQLETRSRAYLGADVAVSAGRPLSDREIEALDAVAGEVARVSRVVELFSMVAGGGHRAATPIRWWPVACWRRRRRPGLCRPPR